MFNLIYVLLVMVLIMLISSNYARADSAIKTVDITSAQNISNGIIESFKSDKRIHVADNSVLERIHVASNNVKTHDDKSKHAKSKSSKSSKHKSETKKSKHASKKKEVKKSAKSTKIATATPSKPAADNKTTSNDDDEEDATNITVTKKVISIEDDDKENTISKTNTDSHIVTINNKVILLHDFIRLKDIFNNIDTNKSNVIIGKTPNIGRSQILSANQLTHLAKRYKIKWNGGNQYENVEVKRKSLKIKKNPIVTQLNDLLKEKGVYGRSDLILQKKFPIIVAAQDQNNLEIDDFVYKSRTSSFSFVLKINESEIPINGSVRRIESIPVLAMNKARGDTINDADVKYIDIPANFLRSNIIRNKNELVGKEVTQTLRVEQPISSFAIRTPIAIKKNSLITLQYSMGKLLLSTKALALQNGSIGDVIKVKNLKSKTVITALIKQPTLAITIQ